MHNYLAQPTNLYASSTETDETAANKKECLAWILQKISDNVGLRNIAKAMERRLK